MSTSLEDEEAPPDLIDVSTIPQEAPTEPPTARVPITLVTGMAAVIAFGLVFNFNLTNR